MSATATPAPAFHEGSTPALDRLESLVSPFGLVSRVARLPTAPGDPTFEVHTALLDNTAEVSANIRESTGGRSTNGEFDGAGSGLDAQRAQRVAIAEALERHACCTFEEDAFIWASARELGDEALDLSSLPRHSARELAHPHCPVVDIDDRAPMRWVRGVSLTTGRPTWVPAVLVYLHIPAHSYGERFALPISTGCAAHADIEAALLSALCEVIERDAIALTWLQRLALPMIEVDRTSARLSAFGHGDDRSDVRRIFFDATTDVGVPTVYSLELSDRDDKIAQLVMCATTLDPEQAIVKVMREAASARIAMSIDRAMPDSPDEFIGVHHGAAHMGHRSMRSRFDFLASSTGRRKLSQMPNLATGDPAADLCVVLDRLERMGLDSYAVDLTTDEAESVGFRVVRTLVPGLMPLSFARRAQYRGHPRLYEAPAAMGLPVHPEDELNDDPQPFA